MTKLIAATFALVMGVLVFGSAHGAFASVAPTPLATQAQAAKAEVTKAYYRRYRRYRRYRTYYRYKRCTRWYRIGYGRLRRWCRYY
jgi:hypothetical protein